MTDGKDSKIVLISKSDKKIVIKRKPAPATNVDGESQKMSLVPSFNAPSESQNQSTLINTSSSSGDLWPISAADYPEIHEKIAEVEQVSNLSATNEKESPSKAVDKKMSTLERLKSLNFAAPKIDVNVFSSGPTKKAKTDQKKHLPPAPKQEQPWYQRMQHDKNFPQPQRGRTYNQQQQARNFQSHRSSSPTHNLRHHPDNNFRHDTHLRHRSYHRENDDDQQEEDFVYQKPVFTGRRGFGVDHDDKFIDTIGQRGYNEDDNNEENFSREKPPFVGRRDFEHDNSTVRQETRENENFDRRQNTSARFGKNFPGPQKRPLHQPQQRYRREENRSFLRSDRESQKSPEKNEQQLVRKHLPAPNLVDRLDEEKLDNLSFDNNDLRTLSLRGLRNTIEYLCEVSRDLTYTSTRLAYQIKHAEDALVYCPKRDVDEEQLEYELEEALQRQKEQKAKMEPDAGEPTPKPSQISFQSTICEETFLKALYQSIIDQADARREAYEQRCPKYVVDDLNLDKAAEQEKYRTAMESFFCGLASGMVEQTKIEPS